MPGKDVAAKDVLATKLLQAQSLAGIRGLAKKVPSVRTLAESNTVRALVEPVLGAGARLIRSVLFNKSQETNWHVAWHQDLAIAVQREVAVKGFVSWSVKEGVAHVQPPHRHFRKNAHGKAAS